MSERDARAVAEHARTKVQTRTVELRSEISGNRISGYAATFNEIALIRGAFYETLAPTAFDAVLSDPNTDVRALLDHDFGKLMGRQSSGTLRLSTDTTGLHFEVDLPNTAAANDARELISRGDLTGMSFQFWPGKTRSSTYQGRELVTQVSVDRLIEISAVAIPAYSGTSVLLRNQTNQVIRGRNQLARAELAHLLKGNK